MRLFILLVSLGLLTACQTASSPHGLHAASEQPQAEQRPDPARVIQLHDLERQAMLEKLSRAQVVYLGEQHDQFSHHQLQLEVIRYLHEQGLPVRIGLEMFQQQFQPVLDRYLNHEIDFQTLLRDSEYFSRWGYSPRLYQPILEYARAQQLPLVALNIASEITRQIAVGGLKALNEDDRAQLPKDFDTRNVAYKERLQAIYFEHDHAREDGFQNFYEAQLAWDEGMAQAIDTDVEAHPESRWVVLVGAGHLAYRSGIPARVKTLSAAQQIVVIPDPEAFALQPGLADFVLFPAALSLPAAGRMGALLQRADDGSLLIQECTENSPCAKTGLRSGDRIQTLNQQAILSHTDLRLQMWDKNPGDVIELQVLRSHWFSAAQSHNLTLTLE